MDLTQGILPTNNPELEKAIIARLNDLTKPVGSLGRLEEFVLKYCLCRGSSDASIKKMRMFTLAADHGITAEGIAPYPKEVTRQMVLNMAHGGAAISVMCTNAGIDYAVVDMGVDADFSRDIPLLVHKKVERGTRSFLNGPAMTAQQCRAALDAGAGLVSEFGADLLGVGEMGIGNTSSASALYALLLDVDVEKTVGAGTGATGELLAHKKQVVKQAVAFHKKEWDRSGFDALCRVGGFEIAGIAGILLGAAKARIPVVVDGFIASAGALVAMEMNPAVQQYLFFAHASSEKFHRNFLDTMNVRPVLDLDMRLGEGTGSALAMHIVWQAMNCYHQMATFSGAGISGKS